MAFSVYTSASTLLCSVQYQMHPHNNYSQTHSHTRTYIPSHYTATVTQVKHTLSLPLCVQRFVQVRLQSVLHVSSSWSVPSHSLWVGGRLGLRQTLPLPSTGAIDTYNVRTRSRASKTCCCTAPGGTAHHCIECHRAQFAICVMNIHLTITLHLCARLFCLV